VQGFTASGGNHFLREEPALPERAVNRSTRRKFSARGAKPQNQRYRRETW